jgi:hypothetical protein
VTITSYPFELQDVTETQFSEMFKELQDSGVVGDIDGNDLRITSDGSGLDVQVGAGFAFVRGHVMKSDATETRTLATAEASPRIDRIVLRLDPVGNAITIEILKGTAGTNPTAPALTQTTTGIYEISLAQVLVPADALNISNAEITDERPMAGGRAGVWQTTTRPASPNKGRLGFNSTRAAWEFWSGTAWLDVGGKKVYRLSHSFTVSGEVKLDDASNTYYIPPFFVPVPNGQTVKFKGGRARINSGTSATVDIRRNGTNMVGGQVVGTTTSVFSADTTLGDGDWIALVVTAVSGTPKNMTVSVFLDHTV